MGAQEIIAQALGLCGTVSYLISFQIKKNRDFLIFQCFGSLFFFFNYLLLGAYTGALLNLINIVRAIALAQGKKWHRPAVLWGLQIAYCAVTVFTFNGWLSLLTLPPQIVATLTMWSGNGKYIRYGQLFLVSPCWLTHNIVVMSIGGVICEICAITSTLISILRFRRSGYDEGEKTV